MSSLPFADPENIKDLLEELKTTTTPQEFIERVFPNWLIVSLNGYSSDYPHLEKNWKTLCSSLKVEPKKIVLVSIIEFTDNHRLLKEICETMTRLGYCVRRAHEFIPCRVCEKAIPIREIHSLLLEKKMPVIKDWSDHCSSCEPSCD